MSKPDQSPTGTAIIEDEPYGEEEWGEDETLMEALLPVDLVDGASRYEILRELGRGSMGVVSVARDRALERLVALKRLDPETKVPKANARFLDEARITAQLQHPSIVAVYEINVDEVAPFFAMELVEGRTLREIIEGLREERPEIVARYTQPALLQTFMQICMAVAYAHSRGVIHRDIKPDNVMIGAFGGAFVMDWGLAKIIRVDVDNPVVGGRPDEASYQTRVGAITGTPMYMSPEQAMGLTEVITERSDIYALGAMLYELLTLHPPFDATDPKEIIQLARRGQIVPPSAWTPNIPPELEAVMRKCMSFEPHARYADAATIRDEIEAALVGGHLNLRRFRATRQQISQAHKIARRFREQARQRRRLARDVAEQRHLWLPFEPPQLLDALHRREASLVALHEQVDQSFEAATSLYQQVLLEIPDDREAHAALRDLYWYRFLEAERAQDEQGMRVYRGLATRHDREGALRAMMIGDGSLSLTFDPPEVEGRLDLSPRRGAGEVYGYFEGAPGEPATLIDPLPMGHYALELRAPGRAALRTFIEITRQETAELSLRLLLEGLPPGMIYVPGGACWLGASNPELEAPPRQRAFVEGFLIAEVPVTLGDYAAFLGDLEPEEAQRRRPRGDAWRVGRDGKAHPSAPRMNPVTQITAHDAEAYCAWRSSRDGLPWRLPTAREWEKAGRGADGRPYPWGWAWSPVKCRCLDGPEGGVVGAVGDARDRSPYGVLDLAGGIREWGADLHPRHPHVRVVRGGSFLTRRAACHLATRGYVKAEARAVDLGFRLALDLP